LTTFPDRFRSIQLGRCRSTSDYIKENLPRLEKDFPLMVSAAAQLGGRGRDNRAWFSAADLGVYATFAFALANQRGLPFLSIVSGVAVADMLEGWTGGAFALKWPNDVLGEGRKVAGILCENVVVGEKITCLVGVGINVNHRQDDFPPELRERAGSLRLLTGREWPVAEGRERLALSLAGWLRQLERGRSAVILRRARALSRPFLGQPISFHHQGSVWQGIFRGLAADGALLLETGGRKAKIFYSGEIVD
jgi:BirA family biotin operon repressor/biotin-[acetyl-CoA-carboxylase] ligase